MQQSARNLTYHLRLLQERFVLFFQFAGTLQDSRLQLVAQFLLVGYVQTRRNNHANFPVFLHHRVQSAICKTTSSVCQAVTALAPDRLPLRSVLDRFLESFHFFWQRRPPWLPEFAPNYLFAGATGGLQGGLVRF